jgi:hypothetical protein
MAKQEDSHAIDWDRVTSQYIMGLLRAQQINVSAVRDLSPEVRRMFERAACPAKMPEAPKGE